MQENGNKIKCKLCNKEFNYCDMSDEHYPAKSVGNVDVGNFDIVKLFDLLGNDSSQKEIMTTIKKSESMQKRSDDIFDKLLFKSTFPKGRTSKTLCKKCNTFLGKYDEAYLKFYNVDGNSKIVKGFQKKTKLEIIKSLYGKFLSIPDTREEEFDFIDFIIDSNASICNSNWKLYMIKRNWSTDLLGISNIDTGKIDFEDGIVYEMSDHKFIYNLINFPIPSNYKMTNIFDILNNNYVIEEGVDEIGGFHGQLMLQKAFSSVDKK